jgi:thioredoxin reductase (NADPH)
MKLIDHAMSHGVEMKNETVLEIKQAKISDPGKKPGFLIKTASAEYRAKTILLATGTKHRKMEVPGEAEFMNKGVSYCALCDGAFYKNKIVCVVGGSDSAAKEALLLAEYAFKVYLIARSTLHPEPVTLDRIKANPKIEIREATKIKEVAGSAKVEKIILENGEEIPMDGVFVAIGHIPLSDLAKQLGVEMNDHQEIKIIRTTETNIPGIFAAGDVTDTKFKQAITGAAEAITAAYWAFDYLNKNEIAFE